MDAVSILQQQCVACTRQHGEAAPPAKAAGDGGGVLVLAEMQLHAGDSKRHGSQITHVELGDATPYADGAEA